MRLYTGKGSVKCWKLLILFFTSIKRHRDGTMHRWTSNFGFLRKAEKFEREFHRRKQTLEVAGTKKLARIVERFWPRQTCQISFESKSRRADRRQMAQTMWQCGNMHFWELWSYGATYSGSLPNENYQEFSLSVAWEISEQKMCNTGITSERIQHTHYS